MDAFRHLTHSAFKAVTEHLTGPLKNSQFDEKRVLTPDEFVAAGDYLVRVCPTWSWEGGDAKKRRSYFPANKQFLVTRNVPCLRRAAEVESSNAEFALGGDEEGWVATHRSPGEKGTGGQQGGGAAGAKPRESDDGIPSIDEAGTSKQPTAGGTEGTSTAATAATGSSNVAGASAAAQQQADDDIPDISDLALGVAADDEAALPPTIAVAASRGGYLSAEEPVDTIVRTRTYDLYITYDQYYQVPRLWLVGYDESRQPLTPKQVLEDVSEEHARKTITVDPHPHLPISAASIHPCRHAEVMKRLVDNLIASGHEFSVNHYLVLFLKFIASIVPTIQYDYTMSVGH